MAEGKFAAAARKIKETNCLPAVCGRVCPQESQCEARVRARQEVARPVAIGRLERFVADYEREHGLVELPPKAPPTGKRVAVVGSGPAGLAVAGDLILLGHEVTVFEAFHKPGGVLMYGIPEFRLPKRDRPAGGRLPQRLGVRIELNQVVGKSITIDELLGEEGFDAVFIGVGAGLPYFMGMPGENLGGVYSASEYLTRTNLMKAYAFPEYDTPVVPRPERVRGRRGQRGHGRRPHRPAARRREVHHPLPPLARGDARPGRRDPPRRRGGRSS